MHARPCSAICSLSLLVASLLCACSEPGTSSAIPATAANEEAPTPVQPPFAVRGDLSGLLIVYADSSGAKTATRRDDIPEESRADVRVDSLSLPPEQRLDPAYVYVADVRVAGADGSYPVRRMKRELFERMLDGRAQVPAAAAAAAPGNATPTNAAPGLGDPDIVVYGASWCGACRSAERFFRERGVAFVEKDIERDPAARAEMLRKAQAAGISPRGVPVIDLRGRILQGFDPSQITALLGSQGTTRAL